jgi:DNA-binding CsgD family transcriptional regulator
MCIGPIRARSRGDFPTGEFNRDIVLILSSDFFLTNPDKPYTATPNEYDFYFLALNDLPPLTRLSFWFPFPTEPPQIRRGASLPRRRGWLVDWNCRSFQRAINLRAPRDTRSYNWNLDATAAGLHFSNPESVVEPLQRLIDQIRDGHFITEADIVSIDEVPLAEGSEYAGKQQHYIATTRRKIHRGEILHIWFEVDAAIAEPIPHHPRSGYALLHYSDPTFDTIEFPWVEHPIRQAPIVPCIMQHVLMLFPHEVRLEPELRTQENSIMSGGNHTLQLPDFPDQAVNDWRELVIFNAHTIEQQRNFNVRWTYELDDNDLLLYPQARIDRMLAEIDATPEERDVVYEALRRLRSADRAYTLTPREREVAELKARLTLRNRDIAETLNTSASNVEEHLRRIYAKLTFDAVSNKRKSRLLHVVIEALEQAV